MLNRIMKRGAPVSTAFRRAPSRSRSPAFTQPETPPPSAQNTKKYVADTTAKLIAGAPMGKALQFPQPETSSPSAQDMDRMQQQMDRQTQLSAQDMDQRQQQMDVQTQGGFKAGGKVGSASKRADGIAQRGKTKGRYI